MKQSQQFASLVALSLLATSTVLLAQRKPAPPPSRYSYTFVVDAKSLPEGVSVRTVRDKLRERHFIKNEGEKPFIINEKFNLDRLVAGTKLVSDKVYQYFPNGVPMQGKRHLKGWQAPFGEIKETTLYLPKPPAKIYEGRKPGLSKTLPPDEQATIDARYDGEPHPIKITIKYHLNPAYDKQPANKAIKKFKK